MLTEPRRLIAPWFAAATMAFWFAFGGTTLTAQPPQQEKQKQRGQARSQGEGHEKYTKQNRQSSQQESQVTQASLTDIVPVEKRFKVTTSSIEILEKTRPEVPDGILGYEIIKKLCELGPRISSTRGMEIQQEMLKNYFETLGATVTMQPFKATHPISGQQVELKNLIARWHPERKFRLLICCHYDTRPFADRDKKNPRAIFLGANDGASGVGLLCELGRYMPDLESDFGIDFVFFDGEEFVVQRPRDPMFLGSTYFARQYVAKPPAVRYSAGVLVDMIGDKDLKLYYEKNSYKYARQVTKQIWDVAVDMGVKEFIPTTRFEIRDDHLPLIQIAGIPTCDIIDFDYPKGRKNVYWHTSEDTPDKCSAESLATVGKVLLAWLRIVRSER